MASLELVLTVDGAATGDAAAARCWPGAGPGHERALRSGRPRARRPLECTARRPRGVGQSRAALRRGHAALEAATSAAGVPTLAAPRGDDGAGGVSDDELRRFLFDRCGCSGTWTMDTFAEQAVDEIRARVGQGRVVCGLSGGVDSSVAAALVHRAVGDQLVCIFVDHGLLRKGEAEQVVATFRERFRDAARRTWTPGERFLDALAGVTDPERKRKIIGESSSAVFEEEARRLGDARYLVQGTLYPDVIESGARRRR